jgi:hypothetical protein
MDHHHVALREYKSGKIDNFISILKRKRVGLTSGAIV